MCSPKSDENILLVYSQDVAANQTNDEDERYLAFEKLAYEDLFNYIRTDLIPNKKIH